MFPSKNTYGYYYPVDFQSSILRRERWRKNVFNRITLFPANFGETV